MTETQNLLTVDMAAEYLHCHPETVRRMIRRGELRAVKFRKFWRVPLEGLRRAEERALTDDAPADVRPTLAPDESARRLAALETLGGDAPDQRAAANAPPLDLSGEREDVYGYNGREARAAAILSGLDSDEPRARNAAIMALSQADAQTSALVETEVARSVAEYSGPEDDWSDWSALDGEPFHFPEEEAKA